MLLRSMKIIKNFMGGKDLKMSFIFETKNKIIAEIPNLNNKTVCQESDILVKIIKDNIKWSFFLNLFFITSIV